MFDLPLVNLCILDGLLGGIGLATCLLRWVQQKEQTGTVCMNRADGVLPTFIGSGIQIAQWSVLGFVFLDLVGARFALSQ